MNVLQELSGNVAAQLKDEIVSKRTEAFETMFHTARAGDTLRSAVLSGHIEVYNALLAALGAPATSSLQRPIADPSTPTTINQELV